MSMNLGQEMASANAELRDALEQIFELNRRFYRNRQFLLKRIGFGESPAILNIDLANAWTKPGYPLSCDEMETIIPNVQRLLAAGRAKGIPIIFTTMAYAVTEGPKTDAGLIMAKNPTDFLTLDSEAVVIDERIAPRPDEQVIVKKRASAFHGTYLAGHLNAMGVDTIVITGVTASACVRHTTEDALAEGFRPIVVRECVGDRIGGAVDWNLFDIDAKFGDVESLERVLEYLESPAPQQSAVAF